VHPGSRRGRAASDLLAEPMNGGHFPALNKEYVVVSALLTGTLYQLTCHPPPPKKKTLTTNMRGFFVFKLSHPYEKNDSLVTVYIFLYISKGRKKFQLAVYKYVSQRT